jgi:hypothetical protein
MAEFLSTSVVGDRPDELDEVSIHEGMSDEERKQKYASYTDEGLIAVILRLEDELVEAHYRYESLKNNTIRHLNVMQTALESMEEEVATHKDLDGLVMDTHGLHIEVEEIHPKQIETKPFNPDSLY